jgi:predicted RNase H-like HicB family nuclease
MKTVRVIHHRAAEGWWSESPDVAGWSAAADSYADVLALAEEGIPFALEEPACLEYRGAGPASRPSVL